MPVLKAVWLASDQLCSKLLKAALPAWLEHYERRSAPLGEAFKKKLLKISPAQIDRLPSTSRVKHPRKGLCATRPGTILRREVPTRGGPPDTGRPGSVEADTVAHCDDSTLGDYVNSITFTELYSGWTENRAVWNKSADAVLVELKGLEKVVPYAMKDFHTDNGTEFLNWALHKHLTKREVKMPWTRSRAYRKNDNAHCKQRNWTHVRRLFGMIFQDFQLFPHMTALQNVMEAPRLVLRVPRQEARQRALELLHRVGLADRAEAYPRQLSGGQKQRVAIARALAMEPRGLLCDEITSALDPELKAEVLLTLEDLKRDGLTLVVVTHEIHFARRAADRVFVLADGQIVEHGPPQEVLQRPQTARTQKFLGQVMA